MRLKDRRAPKMEKAAAFGRIGASVFGAPVVSKTATSYTDGALIQENDKDSRKRRLAELLKKREHSGTATGSASPNPPRGE